MQNLESFGAAEKMRLRIGRGCDKISAACGKLMGWCVRPRRFGFRHGAKVPLDDMRGKRNFGSGLLSFSIDLRLDEFGLIYLHMPTKFPKTAICEVCGKEEASSFSSLHKEGALVTDWKFCGDCTTQTEDYDIPINSFFHEAASTVDRLAHMHSKKGMDWGNFMDMIKRFRAATESFHRL